MTATAVELRVGSIMTHAVLAGFTTEDSALVLNAEQAAPSPQELRQQATMEEHPAGNGVGANHRLSTEPNISRHTGGLINIKLPFADWHTRNLPTCANYNMWSGETASTNPSVGLHNKS
jgi:hypothetical protein